MSEGVSALPNRPSAPSLYSGRALSATELKAAFDRLPTLVAERFNALLDATGLFESEDPKESLAELIATRLAPDHSLSDFFADVANGNLAAYLSADGEHSLADVISEMKEDIWALERHTVLLEGDGDILTDAEINGPVITLKKDLRREDLLDEAKAYADSPRGSVSVGCPLPVSGGEVAKVIEERYLPDKISQRLSLLEAAAEGILYRYPVVESEEKHLRADARVLPHGALCRLGGIYRPSQNLFPERILTTYRGDDLSITWDEEEGCLVFNGTVSAEDSPIILAPFTENAFYDYYSGGIVTHSGTVQKTGTGNVFLRFFAEDGKYASLDLGKVNYKEDGALLRTGGTKFSHVGITATTGMVFNNYKCNIFLQYGAEEDPQYTPYQSQARPSPIPRTITAKSSNEWRGEYEKVGLGGVTLSSAYPITEGEYSISFYAESDTEDINCYLFTYLENGRIIKRSMRKNQRASVILILDAPVIKFVILPADTEEASAPYTLRVKDFQTERFHEAEEMDYSTLFAPYSAHALSFPATFARYSDRFYSMGGELCNYFNFETGMFVTSVRVFHIGGDITFTADADIPGRFHATVALPDELISGGVYLPTSLFRVPLDDGVYDECLWFTEDGISLQSALFLTPEEVSAFLDQQPVEVLYEVAAETEFLAEEESDFFSPPIIPLVPAYEHRTGTIRFQRSCSS